MTFDEMEGLFKKYSKAYQYLEFDRVFSKLSQRSDLHAFILLDRLLPGRSEVVSAATHDEITLSFDVEKLAAVVTDDEILELVRCGVNLDRDRLMMWA